MSKHSRIVGLVSLLAAAALGVAACGGGSGTTTTATAQAHMKLSVGDAPVDNASAVDVVFTGVELLNSNGQKVTINFDPKTIDLMNDSGTASAVLFDQPIEPGSYTQIRLMVEADGSGNNSTITIGSGTNAGTHPLLIPSGAQTGLKLVSGFTVPASGVADYMIDFDLSKAITCPPGKGGTCLLRPALRLVNNTSVGNIQGWITNNDLPAGCSPGVYLYQGTPTKFEDMNHGAPTDDTNQPITSKAPVAVNGQQYAWYYQFTFLQPGDYTVAFTCQRESDDADVANPALFSSASTGPAPVLIVPVGSASVTAQNTETVNITLGNIAATVTSTDPAPKADTPLPNCASPGVYLYAGGGVAEPGDWASPVDSNDTSVPPLASSLDATVDTANAPYPSTFRFIGLPVGGEYTLAATCNAETAVGQGGATGTFTAPQSVTVSEAPPDSQPTSDFQLPVTGP